MKKIIILLLAMASLPCRGIRAQLVSTVSAPALESIQTSSAFQQSLYWFQQALDMTEQITNTLTMITHLEKQIENQVKNFQNMGKIHSYKDFMDWYNRQIYLERKTEEAYNNM